jgi:O-antigen ligase
LLWAAAGGGLFALFLPDDRNAQILILVMFGLLAASLLFILGVLREVAFFALGFSCIINPRKFFGMQEATGIPLTFGEAGYQFLSFTDLALFIVLALLLLGQLADKERCSGPLLPGWTRLAYIGFVASAAISCFAAPDMGRAMAQIVFEAKLLALLLIVGHVFSSRTRVAAYLPLFLYGMCLSCLLEFVIVTLEYFSILRLDGNVFGISFSHGGQERLLGGSSLYRVTGTYGHANSLGAPMAAVALLLWELLVAPRSPVRRRTCVWLVWAAAVAVVLMSFSRGAWLALAVAGVCYLPLAARFQTREWLYRFLTRYVLISVVGGVFLVGLFWEPIYNRLFRSHPSAMLSREMLNDVATDVLAKHPVFGGGIGNHIVLTRNYPVVKEITRASQAPMPVHSIYLLVATEVGVVGAVFYFLISLSLFLAAVSTSLRHPRDPLSPICLAFATAFIVFWVTDGFSPVTRLVDNSYFYWTMMAMAAGLRQAVIGGEGAPETLAGPVS